jgi:quercetin dioxygenase-like cupin family protein
MPMGHSRHNRNRTCLSAIRQAIGHREVMRFKARQMLQFSMFGVLAMAGLYLAGVAHSEATAREISSARGVAVDSSRLFADLRICEVPGVREHLLAKGPSTLAYAGEFTPTRATPWVTGTTRIFLYIVSGRGTAYIGRNSTALRPGDFIVIPKGARHAVSASSPTLRAIYFEDRS